MLYGLDQYLLSRIEYRIMVPLLYMLVLLCRTDADCNVAGCNSTFCDGNICTKCIYPYVHNPADSCSQCYLHCRLCGGELCYRCQLASCNYACEMADCPIACPDMQNVVCPNCPDGFYKYSSTSHCYRCFYTGCKCSATKHCIDCLPGRYDTTSKCHYTCPSGCITCTSANNCSKCVPGKYGTACASDCISQCQDGSCDKDSGNCMNGCPVKQYWDESKQMCELCNYRCSSCINYNQCMSCSQPNFWGLACEKDCVGCSGLCDKDNGCAMGCTVKYYQTKINNVFECKRCPESCKTCTGHTQCNICETGYWGNACQYNCTACISSCDKSKGCIAGCKVGYLKQMTSIGLQCSTCSDNCEICIDETGCQKCFEGYYLQDSKTCIGCSDTCIDMKCDPFTGSCIGGCINGYTGLQCKRKCASNCLLCYEVNGTCTYGCEDGYWGTMCSEPCNCQHSRCNEITGTCIDCCSEGMFGRNCEGKCNPNCARDPKLPRNCNLMDGNCLSGCKPGFYGIQCSSACNNCNNMVCFQQNGTCEFGCKDGFTGVNCSEDAGPQKTPSTGDTESRKSIGISAGSGAAAVIVIVIGVVLLLRRRQFLFIRNWFTASSSETQNHELDNNAYQVLNRNESTDGTYSTVQPDYV